MSHHLTPYRSVANADAYFDDQLYATDWTGASDADKEKALLAGTRAVDSLKYGGVKNSLWYAMVADGGDTDLTGDQMFAQTELTEKEIIAANADQVHEFPRDGADDSGSWLLTITANNGNYEITVDEQTTANIAHDATAAAIVTAMELLSTVDADEYTVEVDTDHGGVDGVGPYIITHVGHATGDAPEIYATDVDLSGGGSLNLIWQTLNDNIPEAIFFAACEEAKSLLSGRDAEQEFRNLSLTSDGVGSNRVTMDRSGAHPEHSAHLITSPLAWKYVQRFLAKNNTFQIKRS